MEPRIAQAPWELVPVPIPAARPQVLGGYSSGCILGAQEIPISTNYWEMVNVTRNRHYGHPQLIDFLDRLGAFAARRGYGKLVLGDSGLPAGGKMAYGHASHQLGIEVDVRYLTYQGPRITLFERNTWPEVDIAEQRQFQVIKNGVETTVLKSRMLPTFTRSSVELVRAAALDPLVNRIFVSPPIKKKMCEIFKDAKSVYPAWLLKVRPYYYHTAHFHVRMNCPATSPACVGQGLPTADPTDPTGVGCAGDSLYWWLTGIERNPGPPPPPPGPPAVPPRACLDAYQNLTIVNLSLNHVCLAAVEADPPRGFVTQLSCRDYSADRNFSATSRCTPQEIEAQPRVCVSGWPLF